MDELDRHSVRLAGVSRGEPYDPHAASGVARHLFDALARRYDFVGRVDAQLTPRQRLLVALATAHPARVRWRERFYKNRLAFELQSRNSERELARLARPFDLAIQVYALFQTRGAPYAVYADTTHKLAHDAWPAWSPLGARSLERWYEIERRAYMQARHVFVVGTPVADSLVTFYGVPPERVSVVGGGAHFDPLPPVPNERRDRVILFVGREYGRKGGDVLVEAFRAVRARIPDARLQIVGTDEAPEEPGVEVIGKVRDRERLAALYARTSVFCLPSRFEPYGFSLLEAMAYGLPCVTTRVGGLEEVVVDGETGLVVEPGDARAVAEALTALLTHPARAARLGAAGRKRVENYLNWDAVVERMAPALEGARARPRERLEARATR